MRSAILDILKELRTAFPLPVNVHLLLSLVLELFFGKTDKSKLALNRTAFDNEPLKVNAFKIARFCSYFATNHLLFYLVQLNFSLFPL